MKTYLGDRAGMRRPYPHSCRDHIVVRHGPNGGKAEYRCGVCERKVALRLRDGQVLARVVK